VAPVVKAHRRLGFFRRVRKFRKATISFDMCVHPSVRMEISWLSLDRQGPVEYRGEPGVWKGGDVLIVETLKGG